MFHSDVNTVMYRVMYCDQPTLIGFPSSPDSNVVSNSEMRLKSRINRFPWPSLDACRAILTAGPGSGAACTCRTQSATQNATATNRKSFI
ncbi:hypothetical protein CDAR_244201 [Caerostris darwini]|uniref:Uncharacterized protein n=1 Tax=Caerostris darwini TaxID=1538125 RepID=A0AAV4RC03_9ARAC|nr:hypothetical protein CDAR_244201 [Caerostris darwini]